jgi:hypothetical protein
MKAKMQVKVFMDFAATGIEAQINEWLDRLDGVVIKTETHVAPSPRSPTTARVPGS